MELVIVVIVVVDGDGGIIVFSCVILMDKCTCECHVLRKNLFFFSL